MKLENENNKFNILCLQEMQSDQYIYRKTV